MSYEQRFYAAILARNENLSKELVLMNRADS